MAPDEELTETQKIEACFPKQELPYEQHLLTALASLKELEENVWSVNYELAQTNKELQGIKEAIWAITER
jgi:hypothetical protein